MTVASVEAVGLHVASTIPPKDARLDAIMLTVAGDYVENPAAPANDCWVWDGTTEQPANVTLWDGTTEQPTSLEVV